jgi:cation-transporting ATPase E
VNELLPGLTAAEVTARIADGRVNIQAVKSSRTLASILRTNVITLFNAVVGGAFVLMLLLARYADALFGIIVVLNIAVGVIQELRTKITLDRLTLLSASPVTVVRDGVRVSIRVEEVVLDDLLALKAGDQIAADSVVVSETGLALDESLLTGESIEVEKHADAALLAGTVVLAGTGFARVVAVGASTQAAALAAEAKRFSLVTSELRASLDKLVRWISWALLPVMAISLNGQLQARGGFEQALADGSWVEAVVGTIASLISVVPQGLVLLVSMAFALGAIRLARKNVLVQELAAVEGLARVDVVCFDKTGTLTSGEIEFTKQTPLAERAGWQDALALFAADPDANATARALAAEFQADAPTGAITRVPFDSARKWSALASGRGQTWVLGAPEFVLQGGHEAVLSAAAEAAATGERVLVLAHSAASLTGTELPANLEPIALLHFAEQIRPDAKQTLDFFATQGTQVLVISGDNPETVAAVAARAGLTEIGKPVDASEFGDDIRALMTALEGSKIIGRVSPHQKRDVVSALQAAGHVVAMTGDGVNDVLALKQADLGLAMGSGSAATKSVANLILLDGKFSTLPLVLAEGRRVVANVERVSRLFLTKTVWAFTLALVFGLMMWSYPYLPRQLTVMDAFAIGIPAFALALLPNADRYRPGFLQRALKFVIPSGLIIGVAIIALTAFMRAGSFTLEQSHTATMVLLSITSLWVLAIHSAALRSIRGVIFAGMLALCITAFTVPALAEVIGFAQLEFAQLWPVLALAVAANALVSITQALMRAIDHPVETKGN